MKLVIRPCPHRLERGEAQRAPRDPNFGLIAYMACCPSCGWPNRVSSKDAKEADGRVSFAVTCRCGEVIELLDAEIPTEHRRCG